MKCYLVNLGAFLWINDGQFLKLCILHFSNLHSFRFTIFECLRWPKSGAVDCALPINISEGEYAKWTVESDNEIQNIEFNALSSTSFTLSFDGNKDVEYTLQSKGDCEYFEAEGEMTVPESMIVFGGTGISLIAGKFLYGSEFKGITDENSNRDQGPLEPAVCDELGDDW
jgi:hypothetical protein